MLQTTYLFFSHTSTFQLLDKPWSQVSSLLPPVSCLQFLSRIGFSMPTACQFFHRVLLSHALAPSVRTKKSPRIYTSMHSGAFELRKPTYTRLDDNLINHRGDIYSSKAWRTRTPPHPIRPAPPRLFWSPRFETYGLCTLLL